MFSFDAIQKNDFSELCDLAFSVNRNFFTLIKIQFYVINTISTITILYIKQNRKMLSLRIMC